MKPVIHVENVGKRYSIQHLTAPRDETFRDAVRTGVRNILRPQKRQSTEDFWALRDVSFDVLQGDRIGIIGRNGAGKSTMLKLLSRITTPTTGKISIRGRMSSLLEVGTGFHPDLTGRENVYLNGAILGMRRHEIQSRFDEIVSFAGVENFLDTPVKRYSSGMYVRLAFSVAAHMEPDILVVDEVLAVGDQEFQSKCLGKMKDVGREGRTVLFVSHNMATISSLCNKGMFLDRGRLDGIVPMSKAIERYYGDRITNEAYYANKPVTRVKAFQDDERLIIEADYRLSTPTDYPNLGFIVKDGNGNAIYGSNLEMSPPGVDMPVHRSGTVRTIITSPLLLDGLYRITLNFGDRYHDVFSEQDCLTVPISGMVKQRQWPTAEVGFVSPVCSWEFDFDKGERA